MKYQIINEELKIASCSIADLTMKQAQQFMEQWEEGASLGTLTLFYERETGLLVLNRDNKCYSFYKDLAEKYLAADEKRREKFTKKASEELEETITVLDNCIKHRIADKEIDRALKNYVPGYIHYTVLRGIYERFNNSVVMVTTAFRYGVMAGKRIERAKRKH